MNIPEYQKRAEKPARPGTAGVKRSNLEGVRDMTANDFNPSSINI